MTAPSIVEIHPADDALGVVLADQISIVFDQEVDSTSVQIIVEGPDTDKWSGPDQVSWDNPDTDADNNILVSPAYKTLVPGTLSFEKIDVNGDTVSTFDYTGGGVNWRTKVVFTPDEQFGALTNYRVFVIGDENSSDTLISGISHRTVFDTIHGANLGDGVASFSGGYSGTQEDKFYIRMQEAGSAGDGLSFYFWRESSPLIIREFDTKSTSQLLEDGVSIFFSGDFEIDDEFEVYVRSAIPMENTYIFTFTTGAGSITTVPSGAAGEASTPVTSIPISGSTSASTGFTVASITPTHRSTNVAVEDLSTIVIVLSDTIDEDTITDDTITVWSEPVNGDPAIDATGTITKTLSVDSKTLTIELSDTEELFNNNSLFVELAASVADTDGNTLGTIESYYFTTTYDPLYSSIQRIRLDLGNLLQDVPDDTINFAIFEASLEAQALSYGIYTTLTSTQLRFYNFARRQFTTCLTELILLNALQGTLDTGGSKSKTLGDLAVTYGSSGQVEDLLKRAIACKIKWEATLTSGGEIGPGVSQKPSMVIKGNLDPDRPAIGRDWDPTSTHSGVGSEYPASNAKYHKSAYHRRLRHTYRSSRFGSRFRGDY